VTLIVMVFVLGPCDSFGVQEKSPLDELILAPTGAPMRPEGKCILQGGLSRKPKR